MDTTFLAPPKMINLFQEAIARDAVLTKNCQVMMQKRDQIRVITTEPESASKVALLWNATALVTR